MEEAISEKALCRAVHSEVREKLETIVKAGGGQMTKAKIIGAPYIFLHKRFPNWKEDLCTYMIPPIFIPKKSSQHQIGIKSSVSYIDKGDKGEHIIYNLLEQMENIGMFVINGFRLQDIKKWNKDYKTEDFKKEDFIASKNVNAEFDFIIFHHVYGVISLEVKNYSNIKDLYKTAIPDALSQLKNSKELIRALATYDLECNNTLLPHKKVIAMPSTKRSDFNYKFEEDILLIFQEDCQNIVSFRKWWQEAFENKCTIHLTQDMQVAYETALSYTIMIRHLPSLGPVTKPECVAHLYKSLNGYTCHKYAAYQQILQSDFPKFWSWCWNVLNKKDNHFNFGEGKPKELTDSFMKCQKIKSSKDLVDFKGIRIVEKILSESDYLTGKNPSKLDEVLAELFQENHFLFFQNIMHFMEDMQQAESQEVITATDLIALHESYPFLKLNSYRDLNMLDRYLCKFPFIKGERPSRLHQQIFETITCQLILKRSRLPLIFTSKQLLVFEGPFKQLIIGPPGSGKTDLLKFKARELDFQMRESGETGVQILFIAANGSPKFSNQNSLFFHRIKEFFKSCPLVEVFTLILEEESPAGMENTVSHLRKQLKFGKYKHVFIDEYWIGSKPAEHKIIVELVAEIPGYVWITSVFDFSIQSIHEDRIAGRTGPLLDVLKQKGGVVNRVTTVLRATNSIIEFERRYSNLYSQRSYPYGTKEVLSHSLEGLPITWVVEESVDNMYIKCADIIESTLNDRFNPGGIRRDKMSLNPDDILLVNFAIRMDANVTQSLDQHLSDRSVPWLTLVTTKALKSSDTVTVSPATHPAVTSVSVMPDKKGKVTLLQSLTRDASSFLDGVEWPMVVVILPSGMLLNTAKLAKGPAQSLRNYDPYISFFRAMVKLVIISDKWNDENEFLKDIEEKLRK